MTVFHLKLKLNENAAQVRSFAAFFKCYCVISNSGSAGVDGT